VVGHDEAQYGVAQELQPFVRGVARVLGAPGAVREGGAKGGFVRERPPEALVEGSEAGDWRQARQEALSRSTT